MKGIRKAFARKGDDVTLSRFVKVGAPLSQRSLPIPLPHGEAHIGPGHARAIQAGRSLFHAKGVKAPADAGNVLVSGHNNVKIGRDVRKGPLKGYWIYTLSLEERATCPRSCHHWANCYGNNMPYAKRVDHADRHALQAAIERDIKRLLAVRGRRGILARLHALGDFFDPEYVEFWGLMLHEHPRLAVYGYTARHPLSVIGMRIQRVKLDYGSRFAIRWSSGGEAEDCTQPIRSVDEAVNSIVCPEQTGATAACATCGLCWGTRRNIAFLEH